MLHLKRKPLTPEQEAQRRTKDFFDCILPSTIRFLTDHYIVGDSFRCVWALREYPPSTEEQAVLAQLADRAGVTLRMYHRLVDASEQHRIVQNATRKNKLMSGGTDVSETERPRATSKTWWICWPTCGATGSRSCTVLCFWNCPRPAWMHCGSCRATWPWSCPAPS